MSILRRVINKLRGHIDVDFLKKKGLVIGKNVFINFGCIIDESFCWLVEIGDNVTFAPNVHILAHDASTKRELGYTKIGGVKIGSNVFVGAGSIILPRTHIGNKVVIGAGSVVSSDIPDNSVAVGVPARVICQYDTYMEKEKAFMKISPQYDISYTEKGNVSDEKKQRVKEELGTDKRGYIV